MSGCAYQLRAGLLLLLAGASVGCQTRLTAISDPPPGKVAEVDISAKTVELSKGVALAIRCTDQGSPCADLSVTFDDDIASVRSGYFVDEDAAEGAKAPSVFVVIAGKTGNTTMHVRGDDIDADYSLTIND